MRYNEVRERSLEGVIRGSSNPPTLDRIRMIFDASFFQINSQVAEAFAARNNRRELLRVSASIAFTAGVATLPDAVLKKYIEDATLTTTPATGQPQDHYSFRKYPNYIRGSNDPRLGIWTQIGETLQATTPATNPSGAIPLVGAAAFSAIRSPEVPETETDFYVCPDDFLPEFIDAMIQYILGQTAQMAAETA